MRIIIPTLLFACLAVAAPQDKGQGNPHTRANPPAVVNQAPPANSNAPGSIDRDKGRDRAEDVGNGKKKGLSKTRRHKKH
jgi:hypothetical protein